MREVFTREVAVEKGMREEVIVDEGFMKRPVNIVYRKKAENPKYNNGEDRIRYVNNSKEFYTMAKQYDLLSHKESYRKALAEHKEKQEQIDKLGRRMEPLSLLASNKSFKKRTFVVYVEKQHGNICTLRDIRFNEIKTFDIDLGEYHDLAGRVVVIEASRKNEVIEVRKVTKVFSEKL